jgi:hypothetical protein
VEIVSDRTYSFDHPRDRVWGTIGNLDCYPTRWPWLRNFDATSLEPGATWTCAIQPPLPYTLRIRVAIVQVDPGRLISATVHGDLRGSATVRLTGDDHERCDVRVESTLSPSNRVMGVAARLVAPVARWGHDWVLDTGARQFATELAASQDRPG